MDNTWCYVFMLLVHAAWCIEEVVNDQKLPQNVLRHSKARFPLFGGLFGSNDKKSLKPNDNTFTESSTNSYGSGLWNYFRPSYLEEGNTYQNPNIYTTISVYPTDKNDANQQTIFNFENFPNLNDSNSYFSEGSVVYTIQNNNSTLGDNGVSVIYTIKNDTSNDEIGTLSNVFQSGGTYNKDSQSTGYKNNKENEVQSSSGSVTTTISNSHDSKNSNSKDLMHSGQNENDHKIALVTDIENPILNSSLNTNIFFGINQVGATSSVTKYEDNQGISKLEQESISPSKIGLGGYEVVPNALSSTNTKGTASSTTSNNSDQVIVICTDPTTGSVIGKYESSSILKDYKDSMIENEEASNWSAIADNSTSLSLPAQLIVRNISMTIHGKIHYCQIVNVGSNLMLQETSATQNPSMVVDVTFSAITENVPISQPSDQMNVDKNTKILINPIVSTITAGMNLVSNLFGEDQTNNPSSSQVTIIKDAPSTNVVTQENMNTSNINKNNTFTSSSPMETTYFESKVQVNTESAVNSNTDSILLTTKIGSSDDSKTEGSVLFESQLTTSSKNKNKDDSASKDSEESLFISHHGTMAQEYTSSQEKHKITESQKVSSHDLHISSYLGHKHSHKDKNNEKLYYSKKPYISVHGDAPYYSTHIYHHSIEADSRPTDSDEDTFSGVFISKPIQLVKDNEESKTEELFVKFDEDDDDDISSDFEKINKEAKYAVFSFG